MYSGVMRAMYRFASLSLFLSLCSCKALEGRWYAYKGQKAYHDHHNTEAVELYYLASWRIQNNTTLERNLALSLIAQAHALEPTSRQRTWALEQATKKLEHVLTQKNREGALAEILLATYIEQNQFEKAAHYFESLHHKGKTSDETLRLLGFLYARQGNYPKALELYQERATTYQTPETFAAIAALSFEWLKSGLGTTQEQKASIVKIGLDAATQALKQDSENKTAQSFQKILMHESEKLASAGATL